MCELMCGTLDCPSNMNGKCESPYVDEGHKPCGRYSLFDKEKYLKAIEYQLQETLSNKN